MGFFGGGKSSSNSPEARRDLKDAKRELERVSRRDRDETPAYLAANRRVIEAEKKVSWLYR